MILHWAGIEEGTMLMTERATRIPEPTLRRLPSYHHLLTVLAGDGTQSVSCSVIGRALNLDPTQVRKDIAITGIEGKPKVGYDIYDLMGSIENFLGWNNPKQAFLAGVGNLGQALLGYQQFNRYGMDIVAAFDADPEKVGKNLYGREVLPLEKLANLARRMHVLIGIVAVPTDAAQFVADQMVAGGIQAIWNFAPVSLDVAPGVIVQNEDLFASLAVLSNRLATATVGS
jgi:redox-sensing transcriptional repressor